MKLKDITRRHGRRLGSRRDHATITKCTNGAAQCTKVEEVQLDVPVNHDVPGPSWAVQPPLDYEWVDEPPQPAEVNGDLFGYSIPTQCEGLGPNPPTNRAYSDCFLHDHSEESIANRTRIMIMNKLNQIHAHNERCRQDIQYHTGWGGGSNKPPHMQDVTSCGAKTRGSWIAGAFHPIYSLCNTSISAIQFAYDQLSTYSNEQVTRACLDKQIKYMSQRFIGDASQPQSDINVPTSLYRVCKLLGVMEHKTYEIDVCSTTACLYWWWAVPDASEERRSQEERHVVCKCPLCGRPRYRKDDSDTREEKCPRKAWFFPDVFQAFFYDRNWVEDVEICRENKMSWYHRSKEGRRVLSTLQYQDCDTRSCYFFELSADGVPLTPHHSSTVYMLRSKDASGALDSTTGNVHPVLVVPGPAEPLWGHDVYTNLVMNLFAMFGPKGDVKNKLYVWTHDVMTTGSPTDVYADNDSRQSIEHEHTASQETKETMNRGLDTSPPPGVKVQRVIPILTGVVADYVMRKKLTNWPGHSATIGGGWCMCARGYTPPGMDENVAIDGYFYPVPQPFLRELRADKLIIDKNQYTDLSDAPLSHISDPRLKLTARELKERGDEAHKVLIASVARKRGNRLAMGAQRVYKQDLAAGMHRALGRTGRMPWASNVFIRDLPYINIRTLPLVPIAHLFLHGIVKSFLTHCLFPEDKWRKTHFVFTAEQKTIQTGMWKRLVYPSSTVGTPRPPAEDWKFYKMQDMSTLLWTGALFCVQSCPEFVALWRELRDTTAHYLYNYHATYQDMVDGHNAVHRFASNIERLVYHELLPKTLLRPNLHIAHCRLFDQEKEIGPAAQNNELWMERGLQYCTKHGDGGSLQYPDTTWVNRGPLIHRAHGRSQLLYNLDRWWPGKTGIPDREDTEDTLTIDHHLTRDAFIGFKCLVDKYPTRIASPTTQYLGKRAAVNSVTASLRPPQQEGQFNDPRFLAQLVLYNMASANSKWKELYDKITRTGWTTNVPWKYCKIEAYSNCRFNNRNFSSLLAMDSKGVYGRNLAGSFVCLPPTHNDMNPGHCNKRLYRMFGDPYVIDHFINIFWTWSHHNMHSETKYAVCCRLRTSLEGLPQLRQPWWMFSEEQATDWATHGEVLPVDKLTRPVIVLPPPPTTQGDNLKKWLLIGYMSSDLDTHTAQPEYHELCNHENEPMS